MPPKKRRAPVSSSRRKAVPVAPAKPKGAPPTATTAVQITSGGGAHRRPPVKLAARETAASRAKQSSQRPPKRERDAEHEDYYDSDEEEATLSLEKMWQMSVSSADAMLTKQNAAGSPDAALVTPTRSTRPAGDGNEGNDAACSPPQLTSCGRPSVLFSSMSQSRGLPRQSQSQPGADLSGLFERRGRDSISCDPAPQDMAARTPTQRAVNPGESEAIILSPRERPSTTLIKKAAATRPAVSPATLWICLDDDDDDEGEIRVVSCLRSPSPSGIEKNTGADAMPSPRSVAAAVVPLSGVSSETTQRLPDAGGNWRCAEPIAEVLPPTFRPRKGPLLPNKPPPRVFSPTAYGGLIFDDDDSNASDGNAESGLITASAKGRLTNHSFAHNVNDSCATMPYAPRAYTSLYIKDDDHSSDDSDATRILRHSSSGLLDETLHYHDNEKSIEKNEDEETEIKRGGGAERKLLAKQKVEKDHLQVTSAENDVPHTLNASLTSPTRSVRNFLFPSCRNSTDDCVNSSFSTAFVGSNLKATGVMDATPNRHNVEEASGEAVRPVEKLRQLYPSRFTRKGFLNTVENVVSKLHCLEPGEFWEAFASAEFVGEGSFGLVWRCRTVDGDLVAVKSCPISFHSRGSIEDAYSVLREIAVMRFLTEHEVPYVLPLHSAFFVQAREALPPDVVAAVEWQARLAKAEEERQQQLRIKRYMQQQNQRGRNRGARSRMKEKNEDEDEEEMMMMVPPPEETREEKEERAVHECVRLPQFLSISVEEATECDATAFLVTELCDGDLESIERHDTITKGVAFCVSSALAAMHRLGLLHLDLKPSNILFAYENSPSQQYQRFYSQQQQQPPTSAQGGAGSPPLSMVWPQQRASTRAFAAGPGSPQPSSVKFYLSDFGNCRIVDPGAMDKVSGAVGTFEYMDLLALRDKSCSRATDCFSLGATLYELVYSRRLYPRCTNPKCRTEESHSRHCFVEAAKQPVTLESMGGAPGILQKVTAGLLHLDPHERWTAERCRSFFLIHAAANSVVMPSVATTNDTTLVTALR